MNSQPIRDPLAGHLNTPAYSALAVMRGIAIRWANLTEGEARRLVELTRTGDRSTRNWWPLVLRAAGIKSYAEPARACRDRPL